ncbi:unnamed protein product [Laminaria digitata]
MTASQRVEGIFGVLTKGRYIHRRATRVWVKEELERRVKQFAIASRLFRTKRITLGAKQRDDRVVKSAEPLMRKLESVGASTYARNPSTGIDGRNAWPFRVRHICGRRRTGLPWLPDELRHSGGRPRGRMQLTYSREYSRELVIQTFRCGGRHRWGLSWNLLTTLRSTV